MNDSIVWVFNVQTPDGERNYVSVLSPEQAFARGLASEAIVGTLTRPMAEGEPIAPEGFARNPAFVEFLHSVIARRATGLPGLVDEARRQGEGWVYLIDQRTPTPDDAVPPEDIIGAFEVRGGRIVEDSYQASPKYRILSDRGFFRLYPDLLALLLEELEKLA